MGDGVFSLFSSSFNHCSVSIDVFTGFNLGLKFKSITMMVYQALVLCIHIARYSPSDTFLWPLSLMRKVEPLSFPIISCLLPLNSNHTPSPTFLLLQVFDLDDEMTSSIITFFTFLFYLFSFLSSLLEPYLLIPQGRNIK